MLIKIQVFLNQKVVIRLIKEFLCWAYNQDNALCLREKSCSI